MSLPTEAKVSIVQGGLHVETSYKTLTEVVIEQEGVSQHWLHVEYNDPSHAGIEPAIAAYLAKQGIDVPEFMRLENETYIQFFNGKTDRNVAEQIRSGEICTDTLLNILRHRVIETGQLSRAYFDMPEALELLLEPIKEKGEKVIAARFSSLEKRIPGISNLVLFTDDYYENDKGRQKIPETDRNGGNFIWTEDVYGKAISPGQKKTLPLKGTNIDLVPNYFCFSFCNEAMSLIDSPLSLEGYIAMFNKLGDFDNGSKGLRDVDPKRYDDSFGFIAPFQQYCYFWKNMMSYSFMTENEKNEVAKERLELAYWHLGNFVSVAKERGVPDYLTAQAAQVMINMEKNFPELKIVNPYLPQYSASGQADRSYALSQMPATAGNAIQIPA